MSKNAKAILVGLVAAAVLSACVATWLKIEDRRTLADQTLPWEIYFVSVLPFALAIVAAITGVWRVARRYPRAGRDA